MIQTLLSAFLYKVMERGGAVNCEKQAGSSETWLMVTLPSYILHLNMNNGTLVI